MISIRALCAAVALGLATATALAEPVDINSADADTLARELHGVGPSKAAAIVEYREQHGPFSSIDALGAISGIGPRTLELNRDRISIGAVSGEGRE